MSSNSLTIPNKRRPRQHQERLYRAFGHGRPYRRGCAVWHRRAGKDSVALNLTARDMFRRVGTYWHLFPEQAQGGGRSGTASTGRDGGSSTRCSPRLCAAHERAGDADRDRERLDLADGRFDNFDSLAAPTRWAWFSRNGPSPTRKPGNTSGRSSSRTTAGRHYTPRGHNHGYATWLRALEAESWFSERLTVEETGLITLEQIAAERRAGMSEGKIRQEFYCSFEAACDEQLIAQELVSEAMAREAVPERFDEKVIGVMYRFGDDHSVIYSARAGWPSHPLRAAFRLGHDAASRRVWLTGSIAGVRMRSSSTMAVSAAASWTGCDSWASGSPRRELRGNRLAADGREGKQQAHRDVAHRAWARARRAAQERAARRRTARRCSATTPRTRCCSSASRT